MGAYTYAEGIKNVLIADLSQFQTDDSGENLGVGYIGWDSALKYARDNGLDYFGSIFPAMGSSQSPKAFQYGMWQWSYYVRLHVKFDVAASTSPDQKVAELADDVFEALINSVNVRTITSTGALTITDVNYMGEPENINDVTYLTLEFLVAVKAQIERA